MTEVMGPPEGGHDRTEPVDIQVEMQRSYIDYAMSVIVGRALPDVRDGLKPVHTRILYAMYDGGFRPDRGFFKCSRVVGEVMGNYHPHGDSAIYDALVRMAQPWSMRMPLVDGQGNFGSPGNDPPAAMRYTECRLAPLAMEMLRDINEETVDFRPNYDGRSAEPVVLPARFPNLLVNGSQGIAVGMATKIPPHNLREVAAGVQWYLDNYERFEHPATEHAAENEDGAAAAGAVRGPARRADGAHPRPGLPDQGPDRRAARHPRGLPDRARLDHHARRGRARGDPGPQLPGRQGAPVPGQPGQPGVEDRRACQGRPADRHRRHRATRPAAGPASGS